MALRLILLPRHEDFDRFEAAVKLPPKDQETVMSSNVKTANRTILAYAAAMWLMSALVAFNASASDSRSETVKFGDLNVNSSAGVEALYRRIHAAAWRVCVQPGGEMEAERSCITKAERDAIAKVNLPLLSAFYQGKTGTAPTVIASR